MTAPPTSIAAASRAGAESIEGANLYPDDTPEARAWQVARDASELARLLRAHRFLVQRLDEVIELAGETIANATAERAETLAEIARLTENTTPGEER